MIDRACRACGYIQCSCAPVFITPPAAMWYAYSELMRRADAEVASCFLPTPEQAVEGASASLVAQALRELGYAVEREGRAYLVDGERVEASEMWTRYIGPIVGARV